MTKIIISGCNGRMGQTVTRLCSRRKDMQVVAGFDIQAKKLSDYPVYADPMEFSAKADALIDFSNPASLTALLSYCKNNKLPCILCATGYSKEQLKEISNASKEIPVFRSGNMSLGINLLTGLVKKAASVLGDSFDVEIIEKHHRMKIDAPSGTALMLADAAASALPYDADYMFDRHSIRQQRNAKEIGISSIRGGTYVGEHEVIFAGQDEIIELKHTANSRDVFANGAIAAASYLANITEPGMYDMTDVLSDVLG